MPRTARETFIASAYRANLEEMVQTTSFEAACDYTMLALMEEAPDRFREPSESWQLGVYLAGARKALNVLKTLHLIEKAPQKPKSQSLNYNA